MTHAQRLLTTPCGCLISATVHGDPDAADTQELRLAVTIDTHERCDQHKRIAEHSEHTVIIGKDT